MEAFDWISKALETLTVAGLVVFIVAYVAFLFAAGVYLMRNGGDRASWFTVGMIAIFLGGGLSFGMAKAVEFLVDGVRGSIAYLPELRQLAVEAVDQAAEPWSGGNQILGGDGITITEGDVTIVATPGPVPAADTPTLTPTPSAMPSSEPEPTATPNLTADEQAATAIVIQQMTATYTPIPPTAVPTIDNATWNVLTPAPTPKPGG